MHRGRNVMDFYNDSILMSHQAFDQKLYEIAFHALSAAVHAAEVLEDLPRLEQTHAIALSQMQQIEKDALTQRFASQATVSRGNQSISISLLRTIEHTMLRIRAVGAGKIRPS